VEAEAEAVVVVGRMLVRSDSLAAGCTLVAPQAEVQRFVGQEPTDLP
jgi:hypothetical protein